MENPKHRKTRKVYNTPGDAHELTFSCFRRRKSLWKGRTRGYVIRAVQNARDTHHFHLWAYVIMPEHVHMVIFSPDEKYDVSMIAKSIKQSVSRRAINYLRRDNPTGLELLKTGQKNTPYRFWLAAGGYERNVNTNSALEHMVHYTHNNPVRRGLVDDPAAWKWSSYNEWHHPGPGPLSLDLGSFPHL